MKIRLISGKYGGRSISAPDGHKTTHPMSERARNALFNILGAEVVDAEVLDAFAGTGSLGLEAMSRGAKSALFIEKDRVASKIIAENITTLGVENTKVIKTTVNNWLSTSDNKTFDIIFADPPYWDLQFSTVKKLFPLLKPNGLMVLSHLGKCEIPEHIGIVVVDNRSYAKANLTLYRRVE